MTDYHSLTENENIHLKIKRSTLITPIRRLETCPWCKKKEDVTHLSFFSGQIDWDKGVVLLASPNVDYTDSKNFMVAVISHPECGSQDGYDIELSSLIEQGLHHWYEHLLTKGWVQDNKQFVFRTFDHLAEFQLVPVSTWSEFRQKLLNPSKVQTND